MTTEKNVIAVIDGAAGSCGKAKVVGEYATSYNVGAAVTNCMPNAGHTFVDENGNRTVFRNIPVSSVNPNTELFIGPGSAIDMGVFSDEYERAKKYLGDRIIYVHPEVPLIEQRHKDCEKAKVKSGSTFKGCGAVTADKVMRDPSLGFFQGYKNAVVCSNDEWLDRLHKHVGKLDEYVILEGAQGCDLDLNHSGNYPYVTSRNVSTTQLLADSGIPANALLQTTMVIRPFPIRISNITNTGEAIYTGSYGTGAELTWTDVNLAAQNGVYPFMYNCNQEMFYELSYHAKSNLDNVKKDVMAMYMELPGIIKKQILDHISKESIEEDDLDLITALEIERLYHKSKEERTYDSIVITKVSNNGRVFNSSAYTITDLSETTTVTKKERRIFAIDIEKLINNVKINSPYGLYLNFSQYLDTQLSGLKCVYNDLSQYRAVNKDNLDRYIEWLELSTSTPVIALGTGERNKEYVKRYPLIWR